MEATTPNTEFSQYLRRGAMCEATGCPFRRIGGYWTLHFIFILLMGLICTIMFTSGEIFLRVQRIVSTKDGLFTKQRAYKTGAILTTACAIVGLVLVFLDGHSLCALFYCGNPDWGVFDTVVSICWCISMFVSIVLCTGISFGMWMNYYRLRKTMSLGQPISPTNTAGDRPERPDGRTSSEERTQGREAPPPRYYEDKTPTLDSAPDHDSQLQEITGPDGISTIKNALIRNNSRHVPCRTHVSPIPSKALQNV
ncbi:hypothetical protein DTO207G8_4246 [Paecilomyces variotii]|nr:hypothetical protein DTO169C6_6520 [Paecilomyces variotii]KAJ9253239.1 hypothetical protein DTO207G8_4246 [Paecilomyces variotii]KAJ9305984.1 hypothetical protein DTO217A2_4456 [Paecilomyces variotii]